MVRHWVNSVDKFVKKKIPDTFSEWKGVLISFLIVLCVVFLPMLVYLNKYLKARTSITKYTRRLIIKSSVYLVLAVCILFSLAEIIFPETIVFSFVWILLVSRWGMDLAWALKNLNNPDNYGSSPLSYLFWVYFAACFFQFLNLPDVILVVLWPGILIIALIHILHGLKYPLVPPDSYFRKISIFLLFVFLGGSFLGYVNLSIFFTASWFILMIGFQFSYTFSTIFRNINERFVKSKILQTLSMGIGIPMIWLAVIAAVVTWAGFQYLNINMVMNILKSTFDFYGVKINILLLILGVFLFFVVKTILHVIRSSLDSKFGKNEETGGILPVFHTMTRYAFWVIYIIVVLKFMDVSITSIAIIAGGLSVGIGLGLQGFVTSFVNGIIILMNRTVRVGDVIQVDNMQARVLKIDLRNTIVQTYDNAIVSVPNSQILNNKFINWTLNNKLVRRQIDIRVKYGVEGEQVKDLIIAIALKNTRIKRFPEPSVQLSDFTDGGMIFSLKIWLDDLDNESVILSDLRYEINKTLMANNVIKSA
jgi:small-conductance mechanosensitive channel